MRFWLGSLSYCCSEEMRENCPLCVKPSTFAGSAQLLSREKHSLACPPPWRSTWMKQHSLGMERTLCATTLFIRSTTENYIQLLVMGAWAADKETKVRYRKEVPLYRRVKTCWGDVKQIRDPWYVQVRICFVLEHPSHLSSLPRDCWQWL